MAELTVAYLVLGAACSPRYFPFMVSEDPWSNSLPALNHTEHRVVIYSPGESGTFATVELMGGGFKVHCQLSRSPELGIPQTHAKVILCDAKELKVRFEDRTSLSVA